MDPVVFQETERLLRVLSQKHTKYRVKFSLSLSIRASIPILSLQESWEPGSFGMVSVVMENVPDQTCES